ncbi:hypothetical protein STEG23_011516, partial [Scotinomys teguina]
MCGIDPKARVRMLGEAFKAFLNMKKQDEKKSLCSNLGEFWNIRCATPIESQRIHFLEQSVYPRP